MTIIMSREEYHELRSTIVNINQTTVTEVWNRLFGRANIAEGKITIDVKHNDSMEFLSILNKYSKSIGDLASDGFSIGAIGKWKSTLTGLGKTIKASFQHW